MIRVLKVAMIVFGLVYVVLGILVIAFPDQAASMTGVSGYLKYTMASMGVSLIVPSVFIMLAAMDPIRHINWVRFAIVWCILGALIGLYSILRGDVEFSHAGMQIIMDAAFAVIFLVLYPYRAIKGG